MPRRSKTYMAPESPRVRRLSSAAMALLMRLCERGAAISYQQSTGSFNLWLGTVLQEVVPARTVAILAAPRLIVRERESTAPQYVVSDRARALLRTHVRDRCEALGHDAFTCTDPICTFDPFASRP
jgi:hypothetical protein